MINSRKLFKQIEKKKLLSRRAKKIEKSTKNNLNKINKKIKTRKTNWVKIKQTPKKIG